MIKRTIQGAIGFALLQFIAIAIIPSHSFAQTMRMLQVEDTSAGDNTIIESAEIGTAVENLVIGLADRDAGGGIYLESVTWSVTGASGLFNFMEAGEALSFAGGDLIVLTLASGSLDHETTPKYTVTVTGEVVEGGMTVGARQTFMIDVLPASAQITGRIFEINGSDSHTIIESAEIGDQVESLVIGLSNLDRNVGFESPVTWIVTGAGGLFRFMIVEDEFPGEQIVLTLASGSLDHGTTPKYTVTVTGEAVRGDMIFRASETFTIDILPVIIDIRLRLFLEGSLQ